ncbi:MAG: DUF4442 domain-containing protein [Verrucomicrobia bacterium]|nr:DUF4442 domain-containing protein [Verrucomicrobiota bacterium]
MDILSLPFNRRIGLARSDRADALLSLPDDPSYGNHLGTVHAGALLALAENTSGEYLLRAFPALPFPVIPVVRRVEAKFRRPARGAVHSRADTPAPALAEFLSTLLARGRSRIEIPVSVHDTSGTEVLSATVEWYVAKAE